MPTECFDKSNLKKNIQISNLTKIEINKLRAGQRIQNAGHQTARKD